MKRLALVLLAAGLLSGDRVAADARTASLTFLEGHAARQRGGREPVELQVGAPVSAGDLILTRAASRLELRFADESVLRLGPSAKLQLTEAHFGRGAARRKLSAKLFFGQLWAKVTSVVQGQQKFQIETENAIAGVRGTTFRVDANEDKSVRVRVYDGAVAVGKGAPASDRGGERHEVAGPEEVSREQWEKLVGRQMELFVAADGTPGEPARFGDEAADAFAKWNQERDGK